MMKCELQEFPCIKVKYGEFDRTCTEELTSPVNADTIVNRSEFCTIIPINKAFILDGLKSTDYIKGLKEKTGIYHFWVDYDDCDDHGMHTMECLYVGKGIAELRVTDHIKNKFPKADALYVSFYECENRIAKYLEQLFLDTYGFELNSAENTGVNTLYAVWDEDRYIIGTEVHMVAEVHANKWAMGHMRYKRRVWLITAQAQSPTNCLDSSPCSCPVLRALYFRCFCTYD